MLFNQVVLKESIDSKGFLTVLEEFHLFIIVLELLGDFLPLTSSGIGH